jgi:hypothetical protein
LSGNIRGAIVFSKYFFIAILLLPTKKSAIVFIAIADLPHIF